MESVQALYLSRFLNLGAVLLEASNSCIFSFHQNSDCFVQTSPRSAFCKTHSDSFGVNLSFHEQCWGKESYHKEAGSTVLSRLLFQLHDHRRKKKDAELKTRPSFYEEVVDFGRKTKKKNIYKKIFVCNSLPCN